MFCFIFGSIFLKKCSTSFVIFRQCQVHCLLPYSVITGGPLTDKYQLAVIRFHWGHDNSSGSEHSIDEQNYPLEVMYVTQTAREKKGLQLLLNFVCLVRSDKQTTLQIGSTHSLEQRAIQKYRTGDGWRKWLVYYWNFLSGKSIFYRKNKFFRIFYQF